MFEYLSLGKPIIASDLGQVAEIVSPAFIFNGMRRDFSPTNELGFCVSPRDAEAFFQALVAIAEMSPEARSKMGYAARKKAMTYYTWKTHVEKIVKSCNL